MKHTTTEEESGTMACMHVWMIEMSKGAACLSCRDCNIGGTVAGKTDEDHFPFWYFENRRHIHKLIDAIYDGEFDPTDIVDMPTKRRSRLRRLPTGHR